MRDIYQEPKYKAIDQGMIFNGAYSESYIGRNVLGIVITPRCDISHLKTANINYLPIVSLHDWLSLNGKFLLLERANREVIQKLKYEFQKSNITENILARNSTGEIYEILKSIPLEHKKLEKCKELLSQLELIAKIETSSLPAHKIIDFFKQEEKHIKGILKELAENKYKEFYLIDPFTSTYFNFNDDYHVILTSEIRKISVQVGIQIASGLEIKKMHDADKKKNDLNYTNSDELIFFLKQLKSPFLEHLIQIFVSNFNRIGVVDHDSNLHTSLLTNINYNEIHLC